MSEKEKSWSAGATALFALPILYVLSVGPADYLLIRCFPIVTPRALAALQSFYTPLSLLLETPLGDPLRVYVTWWIELARAPA